MMRCPRAVLGPVSASHVANGEEGRGWEERNSTVNRDESINVQQK